MATATPSSTAPPLTAEEFARRPDPGYPEELVRGKVLAMSPPGARHGQVCNKVGRLLGNHADDHDLGHVLNNDAGTITERDPDTVRGPDVSFYSHARLPRGALPTGYPNVPPDLVCEVVSPSDRWSDVLAKVAEYLKADVSVVLVLDPERRLVQVYEGNEPVRLLGGDDELRVPAVLPGFAVRVSRFFG